MYEWLIGALCVVTLYLCWCFWGAERDIKGLSENVDDLLSLIERSTDAAIQDRMTVVAALDAVRSIAERITKLEDKDGE